MRHSRKMSSSDQIKNRPLKNMLFLRKDVLEQTEFLPKDLNFYRGDFENSENKASRSIL